MTTGSAQVVAAFDPDAPGGEPVAGWWVDGVLGGDPRVVASATGAAEAGIDVDLTPFGPTVASGLDGPMAAAAALASYMPGRHTIVEAPDEVFDALAPPDDVDELDGVVV